MSHSVNQTRELLERIASGDRTILSAIQAIRKDMRLYERLKNLQEEYNNALAISEELIQEVDGGLSTSPTFPAVKKVRRQMVSNYDNGHEVTIVSLENLRDKELHADEIDGVENIPDIGYGDKLEEDENIFRAAIARDLRRHL